MSFNNEDMPRNQASHEIGCDLTFLSADELHHRISLLRAEIERIEKEIGSKTAGRAAAESLFRT